MNKVRCAIYTRKSSEEGLEQDFNSLHAQREACAAYILSQTSEGWSLLPGEYDDGGLSGGTLERPALQRLLADIEAGRIDIVVVYKVDRLTRSLLDFAKLVETMDRAEVSFVSVTQSFNTTTSMGRLTLNMLLSFAQFEREVTAERIRDKIAASKAKGMWMGGIPPLGYEPDGRSLRIVDEHAAIIRDIFSRYLELGNVRSLVEQLSKESVRVPRRTMRSGREIGGGVFGRGQIYALLSNPVYVGKVRHRGTIHEGNQPPIISRDLWDKVRLKLASNAQGPQRGVSEQAASPLAGRLFDEDGEPLVATHATKGRVRYRYYVSRSLQHGTERGPSAIRTPASQLEKMIGDELATRLDQPLTLLSEIGIEVAPDDMNAVISACATSASDLRRRTSSLLRELVAKVVIGREKIEVHVDTASLVRQLALRSDRNGAPMWIIAIEAQLRRSGKVVRFVQADGSPASHSEPQQHLVKLFQLAHDWWDEMLSLGCSATGLAARRDVDKTYVSRVIRLRFLSPRIVEKIVLGEQPPALNARKLLALRSLPLDWIEQELLLLSC